MKQLLWKIVMPLTAISMMVITKWWHVQPEDAPDILMGGFPLIYYGDGFHTSMSFQFFGLEFFIDLLVYFLFWWLLVFVSKKYMKLAGKRVTTILWVLTSALFGLVVFIVSLSDPVFEWKREWEGKVLSTSCSLIWNSRPAIHVPAENDASRSGQ